MEASGNFEFKIKAKKVELTENELLIGGRVSVNNLARLTTLWARGGYLESA